MRMVYMHISIIFIMVAAIFFTMCSPFRIFDHYTPTALHCQSKMDIL